MKKISIILFALVAYLSACKKDTSDDPNKPKLDTLYLKSMVKDNSGFIKIYEGDTTVGGSISGYQYIYKSVRQCVAAIQRNRN